MKMYNSKGGKKIHLRRTIIAGISLLSIILALAFFHHKRDLIFSYNETIEAYEIIKDEKIVGGAKRYELSELPIGDNHDIRWIVRNLGIIDFEQPTEEWVLSADSIFSDWNLEYGTGEKEFSHEFFSFDTYVFDLWVERHNLEPEDEEKIIQEFIEKVLPEKYPIPTGVE